MRKFLIAIVVMMILFSGNVFAGSPPVSFDMIMVAGVNMTFTNEDGSKFMPSNIFYWLPGGFIYRVVINSEFDKPHDCIIFPMDDQGNELPPITGPDGEQRFAEPGIHLNAGASSFMGVRCYSGKNVIDLLGIAIEVEDETQKDGNMYWYK